MTLATVPPYDPGKIAERRGHAVVVGASVAGLLAARVLIDRFETVTLVETDLLPDEATSRPGVPQDHHIHAMQKAGQVTMEALFPGYSEEVTDAGGLVLDFASDFEFSQTTGPKPLGTDLANRYVARLLRKAHTDGRLTDAFVRVVVMENRPTSLFRPGIAWRVVKPGP